ncbi:MAG: hypothetical protein E7040_11410 [Lentisphaerae bacterium]|nr:hypothetical protein [Lentisphaerota bacterium]
MSFKQAKKLAVVAFSQDTVSGVTFRRNKEILEPISWVTGEISADDPSIAWKSVLKQMGRGKDCPLYLCGSLREGVCFDTRIADLAPRLQKQALELELPRHLLSVPEKLRFQFLPQGKPEDGFADLRVYAVPEKSFEPVAAMLTQGSSRADGFLYPALALREDDPAFFAEEMDPDRFLEHGIWNNCPAPIEFISQWREKLENEKTLKDKAGFPLSDYLLHVVAARELFRNGEHPGLDILPDQLRPQRLKKQIRITVVLLILLLLSFVWSRAGEWKKNYVEMRSVKREMQKLPRENAELKKKLKVKEKNKKELNRILNLKVGERNLPGKLADLSAVLPDNALVTSLRWGENSVDIQIQTAADQNKISTAIQKLPYWKIEQIQQRSWGTSTMITLKLTPAEVKK